MIPTPEDHVEITQLLARYCLTLDHDRAEIQQNLLFVDRTDGATRSAVYTDRLVRTDDGWRIAHRRCRFIVADGFSDRPARYAGGATAGPAGGRTSLRDRPRCRDSR